MRADRLEDRRAGDIVEPDGAEGGQFAIRRDSDDIEVTAIEGHALYVPVPFPALVVFVGFVGVKGLPREPTAGREFIFVAQCADS